MPFFLRFFAFMSFWILLLMEKNDDIVISFLMLSLSLICFFFMSQANVSIYIYVALSTILFIHGIIVHDIYYTSLLLLLVIIISVDRLRKSAFFTFISWVSFLFITLHVIHEHWQLKSFIIASLFLFILIRLYDMNEKNTHYIAENKQQLTAYRQLKRKHVSQDKVAKAEERTRIAREIHDTVGHQLTALIMKLEMLYIKNKNDEYAELKQIANDSLTETRRAVEALQDAEIGGLSAVVQLIRKLEAENELHTTFTLKEGVLSIPLTNEQGIVLYRVIQEALTNVMRHSISKQVSIAIGKSPVQSLTFNITNPSASDHKFTHGFGLKNMQARVEEIGGKINIYELDGQFIVSGSIPYEHK